MILLSSAGLLPTVPFPGILLQGASLQLPPVPCLTFLCWPEPFSTAGSTAG